MDDPTVTRIAQKYDVSVPQLSLRYDLQLGVLPLPRSTNPEHIRQNAELDFVISQEDMDTLATVKEKANPYWGGTAGKAARKLRGAEL